MVAVGGVGEAVAGKVGRDATKVSAQLSNMVSIGEAPGWTRMDEQENRLVSWPLVHIVDGVSVKNHPVVPERIECIVYPVGTCAVCRLHCCARPIVTSWLRRGVRILGGAWILL